jgi:hypothetical protein
MYIPAILLLALVVFAQRARSPAASRRLSKT